MPPTMVHPQEVAAEATVKSIRLVATPSLFREFPEDSSKEDVTVLNARGIPLS